MLQNLKLKDKEFFEYHCKEIIIKLKLIEFKNLLKI